MMDIIRDILTRVQQELLDRMGLADEIIDVLNGVDRDVRREWGGERAYIAKTTEEKVIDCVRRHAAIRQAWKDNEPIHIIAHRHGISRRMVYKIVRGM